MATNLTGYEPTGLNAGASNIGGIKPFNGDDFYTWKFRMQQLFDELDLWDVVIKDDRDAKDWGQKNRKALGVLTRSLSNEKLGYVMSAESAAAAWRNLVKAHEPNDFIQMYTLRRKLYSSKKADNTSMTVHIEGLRTLIRQLQAIGVEVSENEAATVLLMSLPENFEPLITALAASGIKSIGFEDLVARVQREEDRKKLSSDRELEEGNVLLAKTKAGPVGSSSLTCYYCGKPGHFKRNCRKWLADKDRRQENKEGGNEPGEDRIFYAGLMSMADHIGKEEWFIDTGATDHMSGNKDLFENLREVGDKFISVAKKSETVKVAGIGDIVVNGIYGTTGPAQKLKDVLYAPEIGCNLLSVGRIVNAGYDVKFGKSECTLVLRNGSEVCLGQRVGQLWKAVGYSSQSKANLSVGPSESIVTWHKRLAHLGKPGLEMMAKTCRFERADVTDFDYLEKCKGCLQGKQHRKPFKVRTSPRAQNKLELVHSDLCGPMQVPSHGGARYYVEFIDDYSRKSWIFPLREKSQTLKTFVDFRRQVEKETGLPIKVLRSDNGGEYTSHAFRTYLKENGIMHQTSAPKTPQQNGVAERNNRTIVEATRCLLHDAKLDLGFWAEAVATATYIRNRCPKALLDGKSPEMIWTGKVPEVDHLRVFGCRAYALISSDCRKKLDAKTRECILLGYGNGSKAYRLYDIETGKVIVSRDAEFDEGILGLQSKSQLTEDVALEDRSPGPVLNQTALETPTTDDCEGQSNDAVVDNHLSDDSQDEPFQDAEEEQPVSEGSDRRRSTRERYRPVEYWRADAQRIRANLATLEEPRTVNEALNCSSSRKWKEAMDEEYKALIDNQIFQLAVLPPNRKAIGCKWVFKLKLNADGSIEKYKARLVAKGFSQKEGIDFSETFAPVVKFVTIRCILAISASLDFELQQMDVKAAFLHGDLEEEIYMKQPEGYEDKSRPNDVWKLTKSLYGLKQASRTWYLKLDGCLNALGLRRCEADQSVYVKIEGEVTLIVAVYVDDLILAGNSVALINWLKGELCKNFQMKDLGDVHWILGMEVIRDRERRTLTLNQTKYIETILNRFEMQDCKSISTPLDTNVSLAPSTEDGPNGSEVLSKVPYQSVVGSLMYAMVATRPDIAFAVGSLSRYLQSPKWKHWVGAKRVLRYLQGSKGMGLKFGKGDEIVKGYCDADYATDTAERKSTTGYVYLLNGAAVSWSSKRQGVVAMSTTEAEYMAAAHAAKEAIWLRQLMKDFNLEATEATVLYEDNQGCIGLAKNPISHGRTKHIDVRYHFVREKVESKEIELSYCPTEEMVADTFTKSLGRLKFEKMRNLLKIINM